MAAAGAGAAGSASSLAACHVPAGAQELARSTESVVWLRDDTVQGCLASTGEVTELLKLKASLRMRILRAFAPDDVALLAIAGSAYGSRFTELTAFHLDGSRRRYALSAGFGDVPEIARSRSHFAWTEIGRPGVRRCPCTVRAGDAHETFLVARAGHRPAGLTLDHSRLGWTERRARTSRHLPFTAPQRLRPGPRVGDPRTRFRLRVALPRVGHRGRVEAGITTFDLTGAECDLEPKTATMRSDHSALIKIWSRPHWCRGTYHGDVTFGWGDPSGRHGCGARATLCAGSMELGRFAFRVR